MKAMRAFVLCSRGWERRLQHFVFLAAAMYLPMVPANGDEHGWNARYFAGVDFRRPVLERTDSSLRFDSQNAPAMENLPGSQLSVCWSAWLTPPKSGDYVLKSKSDDGVCIWVDDQLVIHAWGPGYFERETTLRLETGRRYHVQVLYANFAGPGELDLRWQIPGEPTQSVSADCFIPAEDRPRLFFFRPEPSARLEPIPRILADVVTYDPDGWMGSVDLQVDGAFENRRRIGESRWELTNLPIGTYELIARAISGERTNSAAVGSESASTMLAVLATSRLEICRRVEPTMTLKKTDACIPWRWASPEEVRLYGCNVLGWGPGGDSALLHLPRFRRLGVNKAAYDVNLIIAGPADTPNGQRYLKDPNLRRTLMQGRDGQPTRVTWWQDALWRCPLHSGSREKLREMIEEGMQANPDLLHFDGALATLCAIHDPATGLGCFCDEVVDGFNQYLESKFTQEQLRERGIDDISRFNYRTLLQRRFPTEQQYTEAFRQQQLSLAEEYRTYQYRMIADLYRELIHHARGHRGKQIPLAANLNSLRYNMLAPVDAVDLLYCEMRYTEAGLDQAVVPFKLAETLDVPLAALVDGYSVQRLKQQRTPDLLRRWLALTTAMGANFCIPSLKVMQLDESGLDAVRFHRDDYVNDFRFIRENASLFEGYESVTQMGVLYAMADRWDSSYSQFLEFCQRVFDLNIPFNMPIAGDDRLTFRLSDEHLADLDTLLVPGDPQLDPAQQAVLDRAGKKVRRVELNSDSNDLRTVLADVEPLLTASENHRVWLLPRQKFSDPQASLVIHLVNRVFDKAANRHLSQESVKIQVSNRLLDGRRISAAWVHAPEHNPLSCLVEESAAGTTVIVPRLDVWGVLRIDWKAAAGE
jgi:hypothetical protein